NGERIEWIGKWHTDALGAKESPRISVFERIRRKRHRRERCIEVCTPILEVPKNRQVFVAQVAGKGAVVHLPVSRRQRRCDSGEVIEEVIAAALNIRIYAECKRGNRKWAFIKRRCCRVRGRMRRRGVCAEKQPGNQPTALHTPGLVAAATVDASKRIKEAVGRKITVTTE